MLSKKLFASEFADENLSDELKQRLLAKALSRCLANGETLFLQGSPADSVISLSQVQCS